MTVEIKRRKITDFTPEFDRVRAGYEGPLYAEISPRTFSVLVRTGDRLSQLRLRKGNPAPSDAALRDLPRRLGTGQAAADDMNGLLLNGRHGAIPRRVGRCGQW